MRSAAPAHASDDDDVVAAAGPLRRGRFAVGACCGMERKCRMRGRCQRAISPIAPRPNSIMYAQNTSSLNRKQNTTKTTPPNRTVDDDDDRFRPLALERNRGAGFP